MSERIRPPILHLAGGAVSCCGGWFLLDCSGVYKCPCGKDREERARKILAAMAGQESREALRRLEDDLRSRREGGTS